MSDHPYSRPRDAEAPAADAGSTTGRRSVLDAQRTAIKAKGSAKNAPHRGGPHRLAPSRRARVKIGWRLPLAWLAELWERIWPRFWLPATIVAGFLALAFFDVVPDLPGWQHTAILAAFGLGFVAALWYATRRFAFPSGHEAKRRLERETGLEHRPLSAAEDAIALGRGDPYAEAIWTAHQDRVRGLVKDLKVGAPKPPVARRDPLAMRGAVLLLLALGVVVAWGDEDTRLARMFMPSFAPGGADTKVTVEAWFTAPDYTGVAPKVVTAETAAQGIEVPEGTRVMIQVHGARAVPRLSQGRQQMTMTSLEGGSYQGELTLVGTERLRVRHRSRNIVDWTIKLIPDKKPEIAWAKPPSITGSAGLRLEYEAKDDYRIAKIRAFIARKGDKEMIEIALPVTGGKAAKGNSVQDLTPHRWAGLDVAIILEVEDDSGQRGRSEVAAMTLPERIFRHPVAREIYRQRKELTLNPENTYTVVLSLDRIAYNPKAFGHDETVYLGLRVAMAKLILATDNDGRSDGDIRFARDRAIKEVQPLLWDLALRVEEGQLAEYQRQIAELQRQLAELMNRKDVPDKEIQKLLDEYRELLRQYQEALRKDMEANPEKYRENNNAELQTPEDMQRLLERMREAIERGDKQELERLMSQLREMMENLRNQQNQAGRPLDPNHPALRMQRELGDIIRRQQQLQDETHKREQMRREGQRLDPQEDERLEKEQRELEKRLGELRKQLGEMLGQDPPKGLGNAEREMGNAGRALRDRKPGEAVGPQGRALEELRRGANEAMRQLGQRFGLQPGNRGGRDPGMGERPGEPRMGNWERDPLGRQLNGLGPLDTQDVKVPTEAERKRVQEILEELRKRVADPTRPTLEREYLERLLKRF
jgi:uncharacterized protein (TIGR02302 family)